MGGGRQIANNKFQLNECDLIRLAAPLENVMGLKENARKDKEEETTVKRKVEEEERDRGLTIRLLAMQGMIRTEQLSLNNTENASRGADPQCIIRKHQRLPEHITASPGGGILEELVPENSATIAAAPPIQQCIRTPEPVLWMPPISPIHQAHRHVPADTSSSSQNPTCHILPVAKLSSIFLELTQALETKREKDKEEFKMQIETMGNELREIHSLLLPLDWTTNLSNGAVDKSPACLQGCFFSMNLRGKEV
ncbi:hypothetical protein HOY80DRAFT_1064388 [Tuber brumale]|nr:hypothetical protein HOY80DRAFT_1064388 [Tuber brumale]